MMTPWVIALSKGGGDQIFCVAVACTRVLCLGCFLVLGKRKGYHRDEYGRSFRLGGGAIPAEIIRIGHFV